MSRDLAQAPEPLPTPVLQSSVRERLGARFDLTGPPFTIYLHVQLEGRLDRGALATALQRLLADVPRLRLRLTPEWWGYRRAFASPDPADASRLVHVSQTEEELARRVAIPLALGTEGPLRLELLETEAGTRLVLIVHHAVADARGVLGAYHRLAARYAEALGGPAPAPAPASTDGRLRRQFGGLTPKEKFAAVRTAFAPMTEMLKKPAPTALFADAPASGFSEHRTLVAPIPLAQATRLVRWAAKRQGTLTDLITAAATGAALATWPQDAGRTVVIDVPVSLHEQDGEVADRTFGHKVRLPANGSAGVEEVFASVRTQAERARQKTPVIVDAFAQVIPSVLPPAMFRNAMTGFLKANPTAGDSLGVSNLGLFETRVGDFGPLRLTDAFFYANAPGLRLFVMPARQHLNVVLSYQRPALADEAVSAFRERFLAGLAALAAA